MAGASTEGTAPVLSVRWGAFLGLVLASVTSIRLAQLSDPAGTTIAAVAFGVAVAVYVGVALARRARRVVLATETIVLAIAIPLTILGVTHDPAWLAAGFLAHGAWDLLHLEHLRPSALVVAPAWYPPACVVYDWLVAVAILLAL